MQLRDGVEGGVGLGADNGRVGLIMVVKGGGGMQGGGGEGVVWFVAFPYKYHSFLDMIEPSVWDPIS